MAVFNNLTRMEISLLKTFNRISLTEWEINEKLINFFSSLSSSSYSTNNNNSLLRCLTTHKNASIHYHFYGKLRLNVV